MAYGCLGDALILQKKPDEAVAAFRKAIELNPRYANAYIGLGGALYNQKNFDEAIAAFRKAIELEPKTAAAHYNLGLALSQQNKLDDSIAALREAIRLDPDSAPSRNALARRLNDHAWALATQPDLKNRDPDRAVKLAQEAVELAPKAGTYARSLGMAHYRAGNRKAAIEVLDKSMESRKGCDGFDWFVLAMAHWQLGVKKAARKLYAQAVEWTDKNQPKNEELRRFQAEATELIGVEKKKD